MKKSLRGIWEEESSRLLSRGVGHLELAWETSLKVTMVKIELVGQGWKTAAAGWDLEPGGQMVKSGPGRELRPRIL